MLKKVLTYSFYFIMFLTGLSLSSCNSITPIYRSDGISRKNIKNSKKPKVIQLKPADCPWDKTFVIKNAPKRKEYGASYAKKQNRKVEKALE